MDLMLGLIVMATLISLVAAAVETYRSTRPIR
jgi:hypothetical protein